MKMNKETLIDYATISILCDLTIQKLDKLTNQNSEFRDLLIEWKDKIEPLLEKGSNSLYEIKAVRETIIIQGIQTKIEAVIRHGFKGVELVKKK
jgi:hypothetical protein